MNANKNSNKSRIVLPELSYKIMGVLFAVHNELGPTMLEKYYQRAVAKELKRQGFSFKKEVPVVLSYKGELIGKYFLDFIVENKVILETKAQKSYNPKFFKQVLAYLKQTSLPLAIIVNFRRPKLEYQRVVNSSYKSSEFEPDSKIAVRLTNISKKYILHHQKPTLVESFFKKKEELWALKDINLQIKKGEKLGIIGPNAAGKSTLLKIICGITTPTTGNVEVNGRVASLIEFTAGFHPDLTGEENIYINGLLLGMTRAEIKDKFKAIIDFSGLDRFIDAPLYTYSGGMLLRLGFSVAIHCDPDILIVDEVLSAGDKMFQDKCQKKVKGAFRQKTVLFVSHNLRLVTSLCPKTIWLDQGKIRLYGKSEKVINAYLSQFSNR